VKLYDKSVKFSVESIPPANFIYQFPLGDSLISYPDSVLLTINANNVPPDNYTIRIFGSGPNGTPVHERNIQLLVTNPVTFVLQPNGGEVLYVGTSYPVRWEKIFVDLVKLEYSTDGGSNWILIADGLDNSLLAFNQYEWVVPNTVSSNCLLRVSDSSDPLVFDVSEAPFSIEIGPQPGWIVQTSPVSSTVTCVDIVDTLISWAVTIDGKSLRTTNGGQTWTSTTGSPGGEAISISGVSSSRALAISNSSTYTRIRRTVSGGVSWGTVYENTSPEAYLNAITMLDQSTGYAIGNPIGGQWLIIKTTDGGTIWNSIANLPQNGNEKGLKNSMKWIDEFNGWFGTDAGRVYRTTDGGLTWTSSTTSFQNINAVSFSDAFEGASAGSDINWTSDGGATWFTKPGQITGEIVSAASAKQIPGKFFFVTGNEVFKTDDFGDAYSLSYSQTDTLKFIDIDVIKLQENYWITGYAVGDSGTIAKYKELYLVAETEYVPNIIPETFSLKQNYPNPFNPTTRIEFSLPVAADVELRVYNILGQQVASLINDQRSAGNHSVLWNANDSNGMKLSSGIYFYMLKASSVDGNEFQEIKKMILLK
jgi:photosystem II stability/assembly factor-like uncharacterized protein